MFDVVRARRPRRSRDCARQPTVVRQTCLGGGRDHRPPHQLAAQLAEQVGDRREEQPLTAARARLPRPRRDRALPLPTSAPGLGATLAHRHPVPYPREVSSREWGRPDLRAALEARVAAEREGKPGNVAGLHATLHNARRAAPPHQTKPVATRHLLSRWNHEPTCNTGRRSEAQGRRARPGAPPRLRRPSAAHPAIPRSLQPRRRRGDFGDAESRRGHGRHAGRGRKRRLSVASNAIYSIQGGYL